MALPRVLLLHGPLVLCGPFGPFGRVRPLAGFLLRLSLGGAAIHRIDRVAYGENAQARLRLLKDADAGEEVALTGLFVVHELQEAGHRGEGVFRPGRVVHGSSNQGIDERQEHGWLARLSLGGGAGVPVMGGDAPVPLRDLDP